MSVTVDMTKFNAKIGELQGFGLSTGRILKVEGRRFVESVIKQSHPKSEAQGRNAVLRDLRRVFFPVSAKLIAGAVAVKDYFRLWTESGGNKVVGVVRRDFRPQITLEAMKAIHARRRDKRGRVSGSDLTLRQAVRGKLNLIKRIVVPDDTFKAYAKEVAAHVGRLRSGFAHAAIKLGGSLNTRWIARHLTASKRTGFVQMNLKGEKPSVLIGNTAAGAEPRLGGIVQRALAGRVKAMTTNIRRMVKYGPGNAGDYGYALK